MIMDDRFEGAMREASQEYNRPPETPRDLMWARIEAIRAERARKRQQLRVLYSPWTRWGLGLAAALAIGIGLGRWTLDGTHDTEPVVPVAAGDAPAEPSEGERPRAQLAYQLAAAAHLSRVETYLTTFRMSPGAESESAEFWGGAGELLASTRLLLDSPAANDPVFRDLLDELELVLVQIVQLSYQRGDATELELVTEGIERRGLLPRLRSALPSGPAVGMEGAL